MQFNALILAGSRGHVEPVSTYAGVTDKALIELAGVTLLERVTDALRAAGAQRIGVSSASPAVEALAQRLGCEAFAQSDGPSASAAAGLARLGTPLVLTTADHGLLRPEWIVDFLTRARADADVAVLLAGRETVETTAPPMRRTYFRFADGDWTGCNLFLFTSANALAAIEFWKRVERDRKHPWRIARAAGYSMLLRYLLGRLTLAQAVERIGRNAGVVAQAVESPFGLASLDVDHPADLDIARQQVADAPAAR